VGDAYPMRDFPVLAQLMARDYVWAAAFSDGTVYRRRSTSRVELGAQ
jgi:hypothetical protein